MSCIMLSSDPKQQEHMHTSTGEFADSKLALNCI